MAEQRQATLIIPGLGSIYAAFEEHWYFIMRVATGALFIPHGMQKLFQWFSGRTVPEYVTLFSRMGSWSNDPGWVYYIGSLELFGGICVVLGLLTRVFAIQLFGFMMVATFIANLPRGWWWTIGGSETPLVWGVMLLVIVIKGGGKWSLDNAIGKEF